MKIYLLRHGQTDWNLNRLMQGVHDIPLNATGAGQAETTGAALEGIKAAFVASSDLTRARQTAAAVAAHLGGCELRVEPGLTERCYGQLEGMRIPEVLPLVDSDPTVESVEHTGERMRTAVLKLAEAAAGSDFVAVSHGGAISSLLYIISGGKFAAPGTMLKNACINILDCTHGALTVDRFNMSAEEFAALKGSLTGK